MANDENRPQVEAKKKPIDQKIAEDLRREPVEIPDASPGSPLWLRVARWIISAVAVWIAHRFDLVLGVWKSIPLRAREFIVDFLSFLVNLVF